jgi:hypothetical protein
VDPKSRLNEIATKRGSAAILARLRWIDDRIFWIGRLSRSEISKAFSISMTQASIDIAEYARIAPDNILARPDRSYGPSPAFTPLFPKEPRVFLEAAQDAPGGFPLQIERADGAWRDAPLDVLAALISASAAKEPVAATTPDGRIVLCPYRLVDDTGILFVRGWDHEAGVVVVLPVADLSDPRREHGLPWIDASADRTPVAAPDERRQVR